MFFAERGRATKHKRFIDLGVSKDAIMLCFLGLFGCFAQLKLDMFLTTKNIWEYLGLSCAKLDTVVVYNSSLTSQTYQADYEVS